MNAGPIGILGSTSANALAAEADVVLAVGTRLQDFTTGSWTLFADDARFIGINAARFDARKHRRCAVVGDALAGLDELRRGARRLAGAGRAGCERARSATPNGTRSSTSAAARPTPSCRPTPRWSAPSTACRDPTDLALTAAGGMPGELCKNWRAKTARHLRLRVRLLLHGLRDRRRLGRQDGRPGARRDRHGRRRQLPDDELRHLLARCSPATS